MLKRGFVLFYLSLSVLALYSCQKKAEEENPAYQLGYRDYVNSLNFVYVHGETADSALLGEDKYMEDNLDYLLKNRQWVLVNFSAYWCKDCRKFTSTHWRFFNR